MSLETIGAGRYRIEETLGYGGMAVVYRAHDSELRRPVAIKVLAAHLADDEGFRERFAREARLAASLSHPNVVQVYDTGESDGRPFIVMELVAGSTLAGCRFDSARAVDLAMQACAGLDHAHGHGVVHRDVKPQNLLLRADGVLKIADFGIARAAEETRLTEVGALLGTAAYLAPEQAAGEEVTPATDIYGLGAVLYESLAGRPPFEFASLAELFAKQSGGVITPVRDLEATVPEPLEAVVMRCLARDPRFRPGSASELAAELAAASPEPPTAPLPPLTTDTVVLPSRRSESVPGSGTWLWVAAAAVVAALFLVLGLTRLGGREAQPRSPAVVAPVSAGSTPLQEARNLTRWLRRYSR